MGHTAATGKAGRAPEKLSPLSPEQTAPRPIMVGSPGGGGDGDGTLFNNIIRHQAMLY